MERCHQVPHDFASKKLMAGWRILTKLSHELTPANKFLRRP